MKKKAITLSVLLALAIPSMASALLNNFYRVIDQYAVQWLGTESQAAIGSSTFILIACYGIFMLISGGVTPFVARATGAENKRQRAAIVGSSCLAMTGISVLYCTILYFAAPEMTRLVGVTGRTAEQMITYLQWLGISGFFIAFGPLIDSVYIAAGNTKFPMLLQLLSTVCNALCNWLFIYEFGWGIAGAALASGCSRGVSSMIGLRYLFKDFQPDIRRLDYIQPILQIGYPIATGTIAYALVYWALLSITISPLGPEVNAALGIGFSALEGVSWPLFAGVMMAIMSLVGRQLGAKNHQALTKTLRLGFATSTTIGIAITGVFWFGAEQLCHLFTDDPLTKEQAILYAQVLAFSQVFVAWEALFEGVLIGAGATRVVFWISTPINVLRVPLAWYLAIFLGWQAIGVWWAINCTTYLKALLKMWVVSKGTWKEKELPNL